MSDEPQPKARETSRVRTIFAVIFGIIAVVGLFASTVAVWANGILFDSDKVASAAEKAIQQPEAAASMSTYVADQLFTIVDLNALLQEQLPDKLDPLSGVIVGGAREFVEGQLAELLQKPGVQAVLVGIVRTGHAQLMNVLDGDGLFDGVSVSDVDADEVRRRRATSPSPSPSSSTRCCGRRRNRLSATAVWG
jgi:hypothetical protein